MLVTKYFSKDSYRYFRQGSFRFGTLVDFRAGEQFRFTDKFEGIHRQNLNLSIPGAAAQVEIGGRVKLTGCSNIEFFGSFQTEINEHVFCCSLGSYDRNHHREMLHQNSDLTHFAEIDFVKFLDAIMITLKKHQGFNSAAQHDNLYWDVVQYASRDSTTRVTLEEIYYKFQPSFSRKDALDTIFKKPAEFSYEKELRLVVRLDGDRSPNVDAVALQLKSRLLRKSIVRFGRLKSV